MCEKENEKKNVPADKSTVCSEKKYTVLQFFFSFSSLFQTKMLKSNFIDAANTSEILLFSEIQTRVIANAGCTGDENGGGGGLQICTKRHLD